MSVIRYFLSKKKLRKNINGQILLTLSNYFSRKLRAPITGVRCSANTDHFRCIFSTIPCVDLIEYLIRLQVLKILTFHWATQIQFTTFVTLLCLATVTDVVETARYFCGRVRSICYRMFFFLSFSFFRKFFCMMKIDLKTSKNGDNSINEQTRIRCDQGGKKVGKQ